MLECARGEGKTVGKAGDLVATSERVRGGDGSRVLDRLSHVERDQFVGDSSRALAVTNQQPLAPAASIPRT
ncbi:hypothetical protein ACFQMM_13980 [Saliphagus sp. GCM10025308]